MKKSVYEQRYKLFKKTRAMQDLIMDDKMNYEQIKALKNKENELYQKYKFIDKLLKASEKIN